MWVDGTTQTAGLCPQAPHSLLGVSSELHFQVLWCSLDRPESMQSSVLSFLPIS